MDLKRYLANEQLSEAAFAVKAGISQATVNRYCNGRVPSTAILRRIIAVTGGKVTANDFFKHTSGASK